jgi:hypothetical protein
MLITHIAVQPADMLVWAPAGATGLQMLIPHLPGVCLSQVAQVRQTLLLGVTHVLSKHFTTKCELVTSMIMALLLSKVRFRCCPHQVEM